MTNANQDSDLYLTYLHNGSVRHLPLELLKIIEANAIALAQSATPGQARTLKQHFGPKVWEAITYGKPVLAGYCMAYLVANKRVPFRAMGLDPNSKAQTYALI